MHAKQGEQEHATVQQREQELATAQPPPDSTNLPQQGEQEPATAQSPPDFTDPPQQGKQEPAERARTSHCLNTTRLHSSAKAGRA